MSGLINRPMNSSIPAQMVDYATKFEKDVDEFGVTPWMKETIDSLEGAGRYIFLNTFNYIQRNFNLLSGNFDVNDIGDPADNYDIASITADKLKLSSFLKHYDIISKPMNLLLGDFLNAPDIINVVATDPNSTNERNRLKTNLMKSYLNQAVEQEVSKLMMQQGINPYKSDFNSEQEASQYHEMIQQKYQELTPESIDKYVRYDYRTAAESWGTGVYLNSKERFFLKEQDQLEFWTMCAVDRCFSHIYLTPDGFNMETWNPKYTFYEYSPEIRHLEDGRYIGRIFYMSKSSIIDNFGWRMYLKQIESLYPEWNTSKNGISKPADFFKATLYPFPDYREYSNLSEALGQAVGYNPIGETYGSSFPRFQMQQDSSYMFSQTELVQVTQVYWKSQRKVGKLTVQDPQTGEIKVHLVDESFDPKLFGIEEAKSTYYDSDEPNTVCWTWQTQNWQGIKINVNYDDVASDGGQSTAMYIDVRPCEFQFRGNDPHLQYKSHLPVIGQIFNNYNGNSNAPVDMLIPYQIIFNQIYNLLQQLIGKNTGKILMMGASLMRGDKDWGGEEAYEKFMTTATNMNLNVFPDDASNQGAAISQQYVKVIDLDETERIIRLATYANMVQENAYSILGITPQRQGQIQATQTATGGTQAIQNSYAITRKYYENFSNYRRRKIKAMLEMAQYVSTKNIEDSDADITLSYVTSDGGNAFIKATGIDIMLADLGVYVENSQETQQKKELIEQWIMKNNQNLMPVSKFIELIRNDNIADAQKAMEVAEAQMEKQKQAQQEFEQKMQQQQIDAAAQEKERDRQFEAEQAQLERENKIVLEKLKGIANESSYSQTEDLTPTLIEQADMSLKTSQFQFDKSQKQLEVLQKQQELIGKHKIEKDKIVASKEIAAQTASLKKEEMKNKLKIEQSKLNQVKVQNANQNSLSKAKHKADLELADKKLQIEKIKIKKKPTTK